MDMWINVTYFHNAVSKHDLREIKGTYGFVYGDSNCMHMPVVYAAYGGIGGQITRSPFCNYAIVYICPSFGEFFAIQILLSANQYDNWLAQSANQS